MMKCYLNTSKAEKNLKTQFSKIMMILFIKTILTFFFSIIHLFIKKK